MSFNDWPVDVVVGLAAMCGAALLACGNEVTVLGTEDSSERCTPGLTRACYGPGQCAGSQVCSSDGTAWSSCYCGTGASGNAGGYGATGNAGGWGATGNWGGYGAYGNAGGWGASGNWGGSGAYGNAGGWGASGNWGGHGGGSVTCVPEVWNGLDDDCNGLVDDGIDNPCDAALWNGHTYHFCQEPTLQWWQARAACHAHGWHLLTINDAAEANWSSNGIAVRGGGWWWMGLNDLAVPGNWIWEDGTPVTYTNWQPGEPSGGGEHCGHLGAFLPASTWNDCTCTDHLPYVCESP